MPTLTKGEKLSKQWERIKTKYLEQFQNNLTYAGKECEDVLISSIRSYAPTSKIRQNIRTKLDVSDSSSETKYSRIGRRTGYSRYKLVMRIKAFVRTKDAPEAFAYEYGSGLDATRGSLNFIHIVPVESDSLKFLWFKSPRGRNRGRAEYMFYSMRKGKDGSTKYRKRDRSGDKYNPEKVKLPYVNHPGVEPRPYMQKGFDYAKEEMIQVLRDITGAR